jgi:hypothetical protein
MSGKGMGWIDSSGVAAVRVHVTLHRSAVPTLIAPESDK